jgi:hypothetical protein
MDRTLCLNWEKECLKWLDGRLRPVVVTSDIKGGKQAIERALLSFASSRRGLLILSYEIAKNYIQQLCQMTFGLVVCDEVRLCTHPWTDRGGSLDRGGSTVVRHASDSPPACLHRALTYRRTDSRTRRPHCKPTARPQPDPDSHTHCLTTLIRH